MKNTLFKHLITAGVAATSLVSLAEAATLQAVQGDNVVFYYDVDMWGAGAFSVSGNTITFNISDDFDLTAKSSSSATTKTDFAEMRNLTGALIIQAKNGYTLGPKLNYGISEASAIIANGGISNSLAVEVLAGNLTGGNFLATSYIGSYSNNTSSLWTGPVSGTSSFSIGAQNASLLGLGVTLNSLLTQVGTGISTSSLDKVMFGVNVTAVPEPETYAMLMAGLGVLALSGRRRKQQN